MENANGVRDVKIIELPIYRRGKANVYLLLHGVTYRCHDVFYNLYLEN